MQIVGIDLAWGERNGDGLCLIRANPRRAVAAEVDYTQGDEALLAWLREHLDDGPVLVTVDAPIVCPNLTGTRPVDRLTHRRFHRQHAACHPANLTKCPRPPRIARLLAKAGFVVGWDLAAAPRLVAEVYPHPAMVRLFNLDRIIKYKKGPVVHRRREFRRYQRLLVRCLADRFPRLELGDPVAALLRAPWSKPVEDRLDALFCALIGYHHWRHRGRRSEVLGDLETGFILLPRSRGGFI